MNLIDTPRVRVRLAVLLGRRIAYPNSSRHAIHRTILKLLDHLDPLLAEFDASAMKELVELAPLVHAMKAPAAVLAQEALDVFAPAALVHWIVKRKPDLVYRYGDARGWLERARASPEWDYINKASLHTAVRAATPHEKATLLASFDQFGNSKENNMATTFVCDPRGVPPLFDCEKFKGAVFDALDKSFFGTSGASKTAANVNLSATIVGSLLVKEIFDSGAASFIPAINDAWLESLKSTPLLDTTKSATNRNVYDKVVEIIPTLPGRSNGIISYQELAAVARYTTDNAATVPMDSPYFPNHVRIGLDKYVEGTPPETTLTLPPLTGDQVSSGINEQCIRAVGTVAAVRHLDISAKLIASLDHIAIKGFMQATIPLPYGAAARALEEYYWSAEDRLNEAERNMIYGRVLGVSNVDVPKDIVPNRDYDLMLRRFIAALAEQDRQQTLAAMLDPRGMRAMGLTMSAVRKAGLDLAAKASLYGWGGTQSVARKLKQHVETALNILNMPEIQQIYGVSSPYQVIERVCMSQFGAAPNVLKARTLAEAEQTLLELVAKYIPVWLSSGDQPLFEQGDGVAQIPKGDELRLKNAAQSWLAANGIGDDQVDRLSQPVETSSTPTLPAFGGNGLPGAGGTDTMDKLRQMVSTGSAPSLDQLRQLIPGLG